MSGEILRTVHESGRVDVTVGLPTAVAGIGGMLPLEPPAAHHPCCVCLACTVLVCGICDGRFNVQAFNAHMRPCVVAHPEVVMALQASDLDAGRPDRAAWLDPAGTNRPASDKDLKAGRTLLDLRRERKAR